MLKIRKHYKTILATITVILLLSSLLFIGLTTNKVLSPDEMNMTASTGTNNSKTVLNSDELEPYGSDHVVVKYEDYTIDCNFDAVNAAWWQPDYFHYNITVTRNNIPAALNGLVLTVEFHDSVENPVRYRSLDMSNLKHANGRFETAANKIARMVVNISVNGDVKHSDEYVI